MIILDASFLVKLILEENGSDKARELVRSWAGSCEFLATIDLALPEALNAIWKPCRKIGGSNREKACEAMEDLLKI